LGSTTLLGDIDLLLSVGPKQAVAAMPHLATLSSATAAQFLPISPVSAAATQPALRSAGRARAPIRDLFSSPPSVATASVPAVNTPLPAPALSAFAVSAASVAQPVRVAPLTPRAPAPGAAAKTPLAKLFGKI
jgi:hypothetical protein